MNFKEFKITISSESGTLEAQICEGDGRNNIGIVVCHPHPNFGGTMANNVVRSLYKSVAHEGYTAIRFNFRGVGKSEGVYSQGNGERQDVKAIIKYLLENYTHLQSIIILGYSFGAAIGSSVVNEIEVIKGFVAISYPFTFIPDFIDLSHSHKYKLFIMGDRDDFTSLQAFEYQIKKYDLPIEYHIIPDADHFWINKEEILVKIVLRTINQWI